MKNISKRKLILASFLFAVILITGFSELVSSSDCSQCQMPGCSTCDCSCKQYFGSQYTGSCANPGSTDRAHCCECHLEKISYDCSQCQMPGCSNCDCSCKQMFGSQYTGSCVILEAQTEKIVVSVI
jgi:hypothetical protein